MFGRQVAVAPEENVEKSGAGQVSTVQKVERPSLRLRRMSDQPHQDGKSDAGLGRIQRTVHPTFAGEFFSTTFFLLL